jgi:hypothetical protein
MLTCQDCTIGKVRTMWKPAQAMSSNPDNQLLDYMEKGLMESARGQ